MAAIGGKRIEVPAPYFEFFSGLQDIEWLPPVGERRWILLTKDKHIRRRQLEVDAILNAGVRAFVVTATEGSGSV